MAHSAAELPGSRDPVIPRGTECRRTRDVRDSQQFSAPLQGASEQSGHLSGIARGLPILFSS